MAAGDRQLVAVDQHGATTAVGAQLLDVREGDQHGAVDPHEAGGCPLLGQRRERGPHQVGAVGGVEPRVVALRLDVGDVGPVDEPGHPAALDGDPDVLAGLRAARLHDPAYGLAEPIGSDRLEHVVDRAQLERRDGVLLVGGHEDHPRRLLEPRQHLGEVEAGETGHLDVEEHRVDLGLLQHAQRLGRGVAPLDRGDAGVLAEEEDQLVERRALVVDDQALQGGGHGWTPGANLGTRTITLVPDPGAVSTTRP